MEKISERIKATSANIQRLKRLESVKKPPKLTMNLLQQTKDEIVLASQSEDPQKRRELFRHYVVELVANADMKTVEGHLNDPRASFIVDNEREADDDNNDDGLSGISLSGSPEGNWTGCIPVRWKYRDRYFQAA